MTGGRPTLDHVAGASDGIGRDLLARVSMDRIATQLADLPTAALLHSLAAILDVLDAADARRSARRVGVIGRLLGRDLVARAHPDPADARVRVRLAHAAAQSAQLEDDLAALQATAAQLAQATRELQAFVQQRQAAANTFDPHDEAAPRDPPLRQRLSYLAAIVDAWRLSSAQIELAIAHARQLLERYAQTRDLLVPLWRQQATAAAEGRRLREQDAGRAADLRHSLRLQLQTLRTTATESTTVNRAPPAAREPSP